MVEQCIKKLDWMEARGSCTTGTEKAGTYFYLFPVLKLVSLIPSTLIVLLYLFSTHFHLAYQLCLLVFVLLLFLL